MKVFGPMGIACLGGAVLTFLLIIRDALPYVNPPARVTLKINIPMSFAQLRERNRAISALWKVHTHVFLRSSKRLVFAILLITAALSIFGLVLE